MDTTFNSLGLMLSSHNRNVEGRLVEPTEFFRLMVSHRRMERVDRREARLRGLRDLDTGEVFLTDERRLLDARR
ncbi:MAG: hypothetical protein SFU86_13815 [Pirellulaceae bacterium]|nr:hypothetical protein [Pirellulaceae bacterium]